MKKNVATIRPKSSVLSRTRKMAMMASALIPTLWLGLEQPGHAAGVLIHDYQFNGNFADSFAGPALVPLNGTGTLSLTNYSFAAGQGLSLSNGLPSAGDYSIVADFSFASTSGFRKIVDFKTQTADAGLYNLSTALDFYPNSPGPAGAFAANVTRSMALTRDGTTNQVTGYVNGVQQITFTDGTSLGVFTGANSEIRFFIDDNPTGGSEASAGVVDRIRIYNGALTAAQVNPSVPPATHWLGSTNGTWTGANWASDAAGTPTTAIPTSTDDVTFSVTTNAANQGSTTLGQNFTIHSLTINDTTPVGIGSGLGGPFTLTISGNAGTGITVNTGANLTITSNVTLAGSSNTIAVNGTGAAAISGVLGSGNLLIKTGAGTLTLTGANTFSGGMNLQQGMVSFANGSLGTTGTVEFTGNATLQWNGSNTQDVSSRLYLEDGVNATFDTNGNNVTFANAFQLGENAPTGTAAITKTGLGTLTMLAVNTYTGGTTVAHGTLAAGSRKAFGNGNLTVTGGTLKTTGGPLAVDIGAGNILFTGGTYQAGVGGLLPAVQHDQLVTTGMANIGGGTLALVQLNNFHLMAGNRIILLSAAAGVAGGSPNGTAVPGSHVTGLAAFSNTPLLVPVVNLYTTSVVLEAMQGSFVLSGLMPNQIAVAQALNSLAAVIGGKTGVIKELDFLDSQSPARLPTFLDMIGPEEITLIFQLAKSLANVQSANIQGRLAEIRAELDQIVSINSVNISIGGSRKVDKQAPPLNDERWGLWMIGSGEFTRVGTTNNASGFDLDSGGVTAGVDYRFSEHFVAGISFGYMNTTASIANGGKVDVNGGRVGAYATWFDRGFYVDASVSGGPNSYNTRRTTPNNTTATANPGGTEVNLLLASGYDWKKGALTFGPVASFQYTNVQLDGFTETGGFAPLSVIRKNADSMRSAIGVRASYDIKVRRAIIRPEARVSWQHEFGDTSYSLTSTFATLGGNPFTVAGPETGRDSMLLRAGVSVQWTDRFSTSAYYDGELLRKNYSSNNVSLGFRWKF